MTTTVVNDIVHTGDYIFYRNNDWIAKRLPKINTTNNSVESRTSAVLKLYWQDYSIRKNISDKYWIKVEVAMAIARADTHLWYAVKTKNNLWNVGNTDSGRTRTPDTLEQWIEAIFSTLNWRYLWNYTELRQLAWSTNPSWPNYATELNKQTWERSGNWINNVLNMLSLIHMKKIDASFKFRK